MALKKALYYGAIGIAILIAVSVVVSILTTILSLAWAILSAAVSLAVLLGLVYVAYRVGTWLFGGTDRGGRTTDGFGTTGSSTTSEPADPQERLRMQYVEGQISEEEFERRIERELESESVEREVERER